MARRDGQRVRLLTRRGYDWTNRFTLIADAVSRLRCHSCLIDGEAVACDDQGIPDFKLLIRKRRYASAHSTPLISWKLTATTYAATRLSDANAQQLLGQDPRWTFD